MENPLVSVIMIFLNEERFIREAVESVLKQTYKNWELIFVDDGSTDGSTAIARQFARNYPQRIRYFEHKDHQNLGMSLSRNRGFDESRGRYIAILDADDVLFPQALKEQVETLEGYPDVSMVYGRVQKWHSWSMQAEEKRLDSLRELVVPADSVIRPPALFILLLQDRGIPSGILVRREVVDEVGGYEAPFRGMYEDNAFLAKICVRKPVFCSGQCWYRYRKHSDSSCSVAVEMGQYEFFRLTFLRWAENYLSKQKVDNTAIWRALRKELRPYRHPFLSDILQCFQRIGTPLKHAAATTLPVSLRRRMWTQRVKS